MRKKKILVVDDDKLIRWSLNQKLTEWNFEVFEAGLAEALVIQVGAQGDVGLFALVGLAVVDQGVQAEDVLLGVLPAVAALSLLGDCAGELEGDVGEAGVVLRGAALLAHQGGEDGAVASRG